MTRAAWESPPDSAFSGPALEHVLKKLLAFFDSDMLQFFEFARFLSAQMIPSDQDAL